MLFDPRRKRNYEEISLWTNYLKFNHLFYCFSLYFILLFMMSMIFLYQLYYYILCFYHYFHFLIGASCSHNKFCSAPWIQQVHPVYRWILYFPLVFSGRREVFPPQIARNCAVTYFLKYFEKFSTPPPHNENVAVSM